jgi:Tol biopolymer transport system component
MLGASADVLAYASASIPWGYRFASSLRDGTDLRVSAQPELGGFPRLSPDGRRLARCQVDGLRSNPDIWVDDLDRGTRLRLTTSMDNDVMPIWSPDGQQVAYRSGTLRRPTIGFAAADGGGVTRTLPCPEAVCDTNDWSPDGTYLVVTVRGSDVWIVPLDSSGPPRPLLVEKFVERDARISHDGKWMAYVSDESGRAEVSVRSLSGPSRRFVVSKGGGDQPVWRLDGRELFFVGEGGLLHSVDVRTDARLGLVFGAAVKLNVPPFGMRHWGTTYDVSLDGRRVYFPHPVGGHAPGEFSLVLGWSGLVK